MFHSFFNIAFVFQEKFYLPLLLLIPTLFALLWSLEIWRQKTFLSIVDPHLFSSQQRWPSWLVWLRHLFLLIGLFLLILALARPQWGSQKNPFQQTTLPIVIILDVSPSMNAKDLTPSRWFRAVEELQLFLHRLTSEKVALVAFDEEAGLQCPLTNDYVALQALLWQTKPMIFREKGQGMSDAFQIARNIFQNSAFHRQKKAILLISDGLPPKMNLPTWKNEDFHLITVTLGKKSDGWHFEQRRRLERWTRQVGGSLFRLTSLKAGLFEVYQELLQLEQKEKMKSFSSKKEEKFQWFIFFALLFFLGNRLIPH